MTHTNTKFSIISHKAAHFQGKAKVAGDKSISHRALMLSSLALGTTYIEGLLEGEDVLATAKALRALGVTIENSGKGKWQVQGVGISGLHQPTQVLDMGNAGTGARLMMGLLAAYPFVSVFTGDASLCSRPMGRVMQPLYQMGAEFMAREEKFLPLALQGAKNPLPITYTLPVASAQVKSAILLAGLNTPGITKVIEPEATRDHTERMLKFLGVEITTQENDAGQREISLRGQPQISFAERHIQVPTDPSSAAFLAVAALIIPHADIILENVGINETRIGLYKCLQEMGGQIEFLNLREAGGEPVADLRVRASQLHGIIVPPERAPSMIDEYPILAIAAAFANGDTLMQGLQELRVKESDRLNAISAGLSICGVENIITGDNLTVKGTNGKIRGGGLVTTHFDHRIAMSFAVLGMVAENPIIIDDATAISTSFPDFIELMNSLGADIRAAISTQQKRPKIIAVDGPAASGKGTLARRLAEHFGMSYLDTGSLYRAVGLKLVYANQDPNDKEAALHAAQTIDENDLSNPRLRQERIGRAASIVSAMPKVRDALLEYQRKFAERSEGAVLDGRDIGTVVCPDADLKIFINASLETRAQRRHRELQGEGIEVVYDSVLHELSERDERDRTRAIAPLVPAEDAIKIDTTELDAQEVFAKVLSLVQ